MQNPRRRRDANWAALAVALALLAPGCSGRRDGTPAGPRPELPAHAGIYRYQAKQTNDQQAPPDPWEALALVQADGAFWITFHSGTRADDAFTLYHGTGSLRDGVFEASAQGSAFPGRPLPAPAITLAGSFQPETDGAAFQARIKAGAGETELRFVRQAFSREAAAPGALQGHYAGPLFGFDAARPADAPRPRLELDLDASGRVSGTLSLAGAGPRSTAQVSGNAQARGDMNAFDLTLSLAGAGPELVRCFGGTTRHALAFHDPDGRRLRFYTRGETPLAFSALGPSRAAAAALDAEPGVVPFDPARVRHWPGLPNVGASCFMNTHLKLVSAMAELDPFLLEHPRDDAGARDVRGALRRLARIRSGQGAAADLRPQVDAVLAAYRAHSSISLHVKGVGGTGDDAVSLTGAVLEVLGAGPEFQMRQVSKTIFRDPGAAPVYRTAGTGADSLAVAPGDLTGHDFSGVRTLADGVRTVYGNPTRHAGGTNTAAYPVAVPGTLLLGLSHLEAGAGLALAFSERVQVPVYDIQPGERRETRVREADLRARAAAVFRNGHYWAVVRGDDGWYAQNDALPSTRIPDAELDETLNASGEIDRRLTQILFERVDP